MKITLLHWTDLLLVYTNSWVFGTFVFANPLMPSSSIGPEGQQLQRRLERNAREQQRSKRISNQIEILRDQLRLAGRPVKSSKSSVLSQAIDYIRELQVKRERLEVRLLVTMLQNKSPSFKRAAFILFAAQLNRRRLRGIEMGAPVTSKVI